MLFRPGPTGRRAGLAAGPDVWEVVRAVKSARAAEPDLGERELLAMVAENTGVPVRMIRTATGYWANVTAVTAALGALLATDGGIQASGVVFLTRSPEA